MEVKEEEEEEGGGRRRSGYSPKNKNPTRQCGEKSLQVQQQALTALVAHLTNQDGLGDLGLGSSSSTSLSLKGSARREKLMTELAARRGNFFLKVAQNAHRG